MRYDELLAWLRLVTAPLKRHDAWALLQEHGTPQAAFAAAGVAALPVGDLRRLADAAMQWAEQPGNHLLTIRNTAYPALLGHIPDAPLLLHAQGNPALLARPSIGVVGSRNATHQGVANARHFAQGLSEAGFTIVSGLALGIDAAAHMGGMAGGASTVAVVGTGIDLVYPSANRALAQCIRERGCIVSEFLLGTPARKGHFPVRNRIIGGLARGVLVVEAAARSGSLITAHSALQNGRDVFAIPGSIHAALSKGCHELIRKGEAKLVETIGHISEEYGVTSMFSEEEILAELSASASRLLEALAYDPVSADELATRLQLDAADTQASLLALELAGVVERLPGGAFQRLKR